MQRYGAPSHRYAGYTALCKLTTSIYAIWRYVENTLLSGHVVFADACDCDSHLL
jgi:hypothetical protein